MSWTDDRIATLKKMWKSGKSAADIAKKLGKGVTRNAVIGKAHRMGLSGRPTAKKAAPAKTTKTAATKTKTAAVKKTAAKVEKAPAAQLPKKTPAGAKPKSGSSNKAVEATPIVETELPPPNGGVALIDLTEQMCKWPIGDPRDPEFTFCGISPKAPGTPYCVPHAAAAYQSSSRRSTLVRKKRA